MSLTFLKAKLNAIFISEVFRLNKAIKSYKTPSPTKQLDDIGELLVNVPNLHILYNCPILYIGIHLLESCRGNRVYCDIGEEECQQLGGERGFLYLTYQSVVDSFQQLHHPQHSLSC